MQFYYPLFPGIPPVETPLMTEFWLVAIRSLPVRQPPRYLCLSLSHSGSNNVYFCHYVFLCPLHAIDLLGQQQYWRRVSFIWTALTPLG